MKKYVPSGYQIIELPYDLSNGDKIKNETEDIKTLYEIVKKVVDGEIAPKPILLRLGGYIGFCKWSGNNLKYQQPKYANDGTIDELFDLTISYNGLEDKLEVTIIDF